MSPDYNPDRIRAEVEAESIKFFNMALADLNYLTTNYRVEFIQLIPLINYILERIESINLLLKAGKKWDVNILWRSVLEVFGKFLFITNPLDDPTLRAEKLDQFWVILRDIERKKDSDWAKKILATDRLKDEKIYEPLVLTKDEEKELIAKPYWSNRRDLSASWSFSGIFVKLLEDKKAFHLYPLTHLHHKYILNSHLVHGDAWGLNLIESERRYDAETEIANQLTEFVGMAKHTNELLIFMNLEMSWIVGEKNMFQENVNNYHRFNPYVVSQARIAMDELFRLQDEHLPNEYR